MKHISYILATISLLVCTACHTTEANYKASYDKAVAKERERITPEIYQRVIDEKRRSTHVVNGDSVRLVPYHFNVVGKDTKSYPYGVVVAEFKQIFNANSYCERLKSEAHLPSYVVMDTEKRYLVVAQGFEDVGQAAEFVKVAPKRIKIKPLVERIWILQRL